MKTSTIQAATLTLAIAALLAVAGCAASSVAKQGEATAQAAPVELDVSAASSLREVLEQTAPQFEKQHDAKLVFNFGASGALQKQIEGGAPADVFVSASPKQVASLTAEALVSDDATATFAGNELVVFVPKGNPAGIIGPRDLSKIDRIATGNPETAPHGTKAKEWLEGIGLWTSLAPHFVFAENAAQTLDYVARGEVDAGIGFASEARGSDAVEIVYTVPRGEITPIRYVAAPIVTTSRPDLAAAYLEFLFSPIVQDALTDAGFRPPPAN